MTCADLTSYAGLQPLQTRLLGDILNSDILNRNPSLFLAYNHSSEVMEMYEIRTTPNDGAGECCHTGCLVEACAAPSSPSTLLRMLRKSLTWGLRLLRIYF